MMSAYDWSSVYHVIELGWSGIATVASITIIDAVLVCHHRKDLQAVPSIATSIGRRWVS